MEQLPSKFQLGSRVFVDLKQAGAFDAFVIRVHFTVSKVSYDVSVDVGANDEEVFKTRLYNIDSAFVVEPNEENYRQLFEDRKYPSTRN